MKYLTARNTLTILAIAGLLFLIYSLMHFRVWDDGSWQVIIHNDYFRFGGCIPWEMGCIQ